MAAPPGKRTSSHSERVTRLESELRDQGAALGRREQPGRDAAATAAEVLRRADVDHLLVAARGSSDNAARYAQYLLGSEYGLTVALAAPWLYRPDGPGAPRFNGAAAMAISQSGRSPDIVAVLAAARAQGRPTIAITNDPGSPVAAEADVVVPLLVGPERSVAATKTYTASLHAIAQIAAALTPHPDRDAWFGRLPALVTAAADEHLTARARFDVLDGGASITVVGRGLNYATAYETALKLRELSGTPAEAFSPPELLHGPVAALGPSSRLWVIAMADGEGPDVATEHALIDRSGPSVVVSDDERRLEPAKVAVRLPIGMPAWVAPMVAVIPGQAAALRLAERRGVDVDAPHGLSKVTLTR